jgi:chemotaxis protein MotB
VNRILLSCLLLALGSACVTRSEYEKERNARTAAESKFGELRQYQVDLESENRRLANEMKMLEASLSDRRKGVTDARAIQDEYERKLAELQKRLESAGGPEGSGGDVEVFQTPEGTVVGIKDGVLFASGSKEILVKGRELLDRLAAEIAASPYHIRVEGHTDTDPVVRSKNEFPLGNIQLSAARAVEVAGFLCQNAKTRIPEERITVSGYGPNRPRAAGSSAEAKRKNRRVDILLLNAPPGTIHAGEASEGGK